MNEMDRRERERRRKREIERLREKEPRMPLGLATRHDTEDEERSVVFVGCSSFFFYPTKHAADDIFTAVTRHTHPHAHMRIMHPHLDARLTRTKSKNA